MTDSIKGNLLREFLKGLRKGTEIKMVHSNVPKNQEDETTERMDRILLGTIEEVF